MGTGPLHGKREVGKLLGLEISNYSPTQETVFDLTTVVDKADVAKLDPAVCGRKQPPLQLSQDSETKGVFVAMRVKSSSSEGQCDSGDGTNSRHSLTLKGGKAAMSFLGQRRTEDR